MTSKFLRVFLAAATILTVPALAQTGGASAPSGSTAAPGSGLPAAPSATPSPSSPAAPNAGSITGSKVGAINIEGAIFNTNEGRRDLEALSKKFEPKQAELKSQNDELEALKKQMTTQQDKLNEDARATLQKQIESKQKTFDRSVQDAQEDFGNQQQEVATKILQKMAPVIVKYAQENGYGMIIDTSKPWPQGPVLIAGDNVDITKPVVDAYNVQSGVAAPAAPAGSTTPKPAGPKPAAPSTTKPSSSPSAPPK